jgi:hypothetical protein
VPYRLSTFPIVSLNEVPFTERQDIQEYAKDFLRIRGDVEAFGDNFVSRKGAVEL